MTGWVSENLQQVGLWGEVDGPLGPSLQTKPQRKQGRDECAGLWGVSDLPAKRVRVQMEKGQVYHATKGQLRSERVRG